MSFQENEENGPCVGAISFSHVHLYVDKLEDLEVYKALESKLNVFCCKTNDSKSALSLENKKHLWNSLDGDCADIDHGTFAPQNRDVVKQMISGFGFRVTGALYPKDAYDEGGIDTRSVLVTSRDPKGVQFLITACATESDVKPTLGTKDFRELLEAKRVGTFMNAHSGRQGIGVLGFAVENVEAIRQRYKKLHPKLVLGFEQLTHSGSLVKILEVCAYYMDRSSNDTSSERVADRGTVIRYIECGEALDSGVLCHILGLKHVDATFDDSSKAAYCDHWVSNVFSRTEFLDTLNDTLGFEPKVDFNAGVVSAGEAQIESTVTGNHASLETDDALRALVDQSQVYLPINNALSSVGHVHLFLEQLGQGIQHVASRVDNLVDFVQRGNDYRKITGEGFSFLNIPRSYYGVLDEGQLAGGIAGDGLDSVGKGSAAEIMSALRRSRNLTKDGAVSLDMTRDEIDSALMESIRDVQAKEEYLQKKEGVLNVIMRSRYRNLYSLLRDQVSEETYLGIVRNQILVDIQGEDLLYQIFTSNILQRNPGEEAPFLEFIERVCSKNVFKPGCGGFGIRNFLTLFLSIEVSKAMQDVYDSIEAGDFERQKYAQSMVEIFTAQLNESNPILTEISDAMTEEGRCKEKMAQCLHNGNQDAASHWESKMAAAAEKKAEGNRALMHCSSRFQKQMKSIREKRQNTAICVQEQ